MHLHVMRRLPEELLHLVLQHWAAARIQSAFVRWHRLRHAGTGYGRAFVRASRVRCTDCWRRPPASDESG